MSRRNDSISYKELFESDFNAAAYDLMDFIHRKVSLNQLRTAWPKNARKTIYKMERAGVKKARRSALGALRARGF